jgi:hypothetical protein
VAECDEVVLIGGLKEIVQEVVRQVQLDALVSAYRHAMQAPMDRQCGPQRHGFQEAVSTAQTQGQRGTSRLNKWIKKLHNRGLHLVVMPHPKMTAMVKANKLRPGDLAGGVLCAGIGAEAIVSHTDD